MSIVASVNAAAAGAQVAQAQAQAAQSTAHTTPAVREIDIQSVTPPEQAATSHNDNAGGYGPDGGQTDSSTQRTLVDIKV